MAAKCTALGVQDKFPYGGKKSVLYRNVTPSSNTMTVILLGYIHRTHRIV